MEIFRSTVEGLAVFVGENLSWFALLGVAVLASAIYLWRGILLGASQKFMNLRHFRVDQIDPVDFSLHPSGFGQRASIAVYGVYSWLRSGQFARSRYLLLFFVVFAVWLVSRRVEMVMPGTSFFRDAVAPSLFAFALDGMLIVGFLGFISEQRDLRDELRLREVLLRFCSRFGSIARVHLVAHDGMGAFGGETFQAQRTLNRAVRAHGLVAPAQASHFQSEFSALAVELDSAAHALLPVASGLSAEDAHAWVSLCLNLRRVQGAPKEEFVHAMIEVLAAAVTIEWKLMELRGVTLNIQQRANLL